MALTNAPKINNLTPILAKLGEDFKEKEDKGMNELLKKLIAKLGLKAEATEDEVLAAVTASLAKNTELETGCS